jgi:hypothetical protein
MDYYRENSVQNLCGSGFKRFSGGEGGGGQLLTVEQINKKLLIFASVLGI